MSAEESRKKSAAVQEETKAEASRKTAESKKAHISEADHLLKHFMQLIAKASNQGKFEIDKQIFAADRFRPSVIETVIDDLKSEGYNVSTSNNNALHQIIFHISW